MLKILEKSPLFKGLSLEEIERFVQHSGSHTATYTKNQIIFDMQQKPEYMYVLLKGAIAICKDSISGKRMVMTNIDDIGDIFAEVFLFLPKESYDYYTVAITNEITLLKIPKTAFSNDPQDYIQHRLVYNMLIILSQKAYNLTQKLQILASGNLRQKLSKMMLDAMDEEGNVLFSMTREQMADYLNVARPSLSRELANMQTEGLIEVKGRVVKVLDPEALEFDL
ncbi:MAG: Crp/Fnr family transcriptional regulator [Peptostreptococcaceae bacterium]|nr:Crp/Fnr family transcriptional regulator [Peptostreptococcaceae bacterium]